MRKFVDEFVYPDAQVSTFLDIRKRSSHMYCLQQAREEDGKRPSQSVIDAMAAVNLHAMRLGPGKHLKGKILLDGLVSPEEVRTLNTSEVADRDDMRL